MGCRYVTIYLTYFILPVRQAQWHRHYFEYDKFKRMQWTNSRALFCLSDEKENRLFPEKGAMTHTANHSMTTLRKISGNGVIY